MTTDFSQPYNPLVWGGIDNTTIEPPAPLHWRTYRLPASDPDVQLYGADGVVGWELKLDDLRGGLLQVGDFARGSNLYDGDYRGTAQSTLDARWRRHLMLPPQTTRQTNLTGKTPVSNPLVWCYLNNELWLAHGDDGFNTQCLFKEGGSWSLTAVPYTGSTSDNIVSLGPITIGGVTTGERLFVGRQNQPPQVLNTDGSYAGGSAGAATMHASLANAFGILSSPANATSPGTRTNLIYASNKLWALPV